jgi:hypothetical protein
MKRNRKSVSIIHWVACFCVVTALGLLATQRTARSAQSPKRKITAEPTGAAAAIPEEAARQQRSPRVQISKGKRVVPSEFRGDVRRLPRHITPAQRRFFHPPLELEFKPPQKKKPLPSAQPLIPTDLPPLGPLAPMPTPATSFNGMNFNANGAGHPPDTVGDVGPNHFVQAVNTSIGIYDKTTGAAISTFTFSSLWSGAGTGTGCDTIHGGDPTVIYDPQNDRFIVADFSWSNLQNGPYYECMAVSKTSNPVTGGWWLYAFRADDAAHAWFPDYPKMGIWPDGLYMSANMFDCLNASCSSSSYQEVRAFALNISDLESGAVLRSVIADVGGGSSHFSLLPGNYRGTPPPVGTPNYFVAESETLFAWEVFKFHADYVTPANSTFTGPTNVSQAIYVSAADPVPEPAPGNNTDTLADRAMMQNQYRNISGAESLWVNHTTGTAAASAPTGVQWAQINVTGGTINTTPVQQQIYNNGADGLNRFMGALAVDRQGNMALGYTASSTAVAPDIRYVGRLSTDPLNTLPQTEVTMLPSVARSVQTGSCGGTCTRWGDYSAMTVDPVDDCTFWYTNMYFPVAGSNWVTRIGSFKFPGCSSGVASLTINTVTPAAGRASGAQQIHLTGVLAGLSTVTMGGASASWFYTNGAGDTSAITVTTPPHAVGAVQIDLTSTAGSMYSKANAFAYLPTVFTDDTMVAQQTTVKAQHIIELRQAVDAMRAVAGLSAAPWTDPALAAGNTIKAIHILDLRTFLDDAATRLGYSTSPYTDPGLTSGFVIKRIHIEELRQRIRTIAG